MTKLDGGKTRRLTTIIAPAGYGKTTLLIDWINHRQANVAWLSLDETDNEPERFWSYVIKCLAEHIPGLDEQVAQPHFAQDVPIRAVLNDVLNQLSNASEPIIFVLDDYHFITSPKIHVNVAWFLEHCPLQFHIYITSRHEANLPVARLRARDQLVELSTENLRFTKEEAKEFFSSVMHLNLKESEVNVLEKNTEGWVAGLQLAALSIQQVGDKSKIIEGFSGTHRHIVDYLGEEILAKQPTETQDFLLKTSILERLYAPLCKTVTGQNNAQETIEKLEKANAFILPLDNERHWYRYHHLFKDFLCEQLKKRYPEAVSELHALACKWYKQEGSIDNAIEHALMGELWHEASSLIEGIANIMSDSRFSLLLNWLERLPPEHIESKPILCLAQARALCNAGYQNPELFSTLIHIAEHSAKETNDQYLLGRVYLFRTELAHLYGDLDKVQGLCQKALKTLPKDAIVARSSALFELGTYYLDVGEFNKAHENLLISRRMSQQINRYVDVEHTNMQLAKLHLYQGQLVKAKQVTEGVLKKCKTSMTWAEVLAHTVLTNILCQQNELEQAMHIALDSLDLVKKVYEHGFWYSSYIALAKVYLSLRDEDNAEQALHHALQAANKLGRNKQHSVEWHLQLLKLRQGKIDEVETWLSSQNLEIDRLDWQKENPYIIWLRVLLFNDLEKAIKVFHALKKSLQESQKSHDLIEVLVLGALVHQKRNETKKAIALLDEALDFAIPEGYKRVFLDEGTVMIKLLNAALETSKYTVYIRQLLAAFLHEPDLKITSIKGLIKPLSKTELDVLHLLAAGSNMHTISKKLNLEPSITNMHITNVYAKLGASSRSGALIKARSLHLI